MSALIEHEGLVAIELCFIGCYLMEEVITKRGGTSAKTNLQSDTMSYYSSSSSLPAGLDPIGP
jgi:hypothetical protein